MYYLSKSTSGVSHSRYIRWSDSHYLRGAYLSVYCKGSAEGT